MVSFDEIGAEYVMNENTCNRVRKKRREALGKGGVKS